MIPNPRRPETNGTPVCAPCVGLNGCLLSYAHEASRREDHRRMSNGEQVFRIAGFAIKAKPSVDFGGYWQRHLAP